MYTTRIFWNQNLSEAEGQQKLQDLWAKAPTVIGGQGRIGSREGPYPDWLAGVLGRYFLYDHVNYSYFVSTGSTPWSHYRLAKWLIVFLGAVTIGARFRLLVKLFFSGYPLISMRMLPLVFRLPPGHAETASHLRVIIFEDLDETDMGSIDWTH